MRYLSGNTAPFRRAAAVMCPSSGLGKGCSTAEGARHQHQRRLLQPALHRQHLAAYATVMTTHAARLSQAWQDGDTLDITRP